jgi:hypothetical protein
MAYGARFLPNAMVSQGYGLIESIELNGWYFISFPALRLLALCK